MSLGKQMKEEKSWMCLGLDVRLRGMGKDTEEWSVEWPCCLVFRNERTFYLGKHIELSVLGNTSDLRCVGSFLYRASKLVTSSLSTSWMSNSSVMTLCLDLVRSHRVGAQSFRSVLT